MKALWMDFTFWIGVAAQVVFVAVVVFALVGSAVDHWRRRGAPEPSEWERGDDDYRGGLGGGAA